MRRALPAIGIALLLVAIVGGQVLRSGLDLEMSTAAIQERVTAYGWKGPAVYLTLVIFRQFLAIPAILLLTASGLCFGALIGGALGAAGIVISGVMKFSLARAFGRDALQRWGRGIPPRLERGLGQLGPIAVGALTAHPIGPLAPLHWAAGLAPISLGAFALALVLGAPVRAYAYALFGHALTDVGSPTFWVSTTLLVAAVAIPFLIPSIRGRIRSAARA